MTYVVALLDLLLGCLFVLAVLQEDHEVSYRWVQAHRTVAAALAFVLFLSAAYLLQGTVR